MAEASWTVRLPGGDLRAAAIDGLLLARGVRYARAGRFEPAEGLGPWRGVQDALDRGPACPQVPSRLLPVTGEIAEAMPQHEDCLVLSVAAPVPDGRPRPVMIWLHGGANLSGAGEAPAYDPARLAREGDVVVVTVTYRLGLFGWLAVPGLAPPNLALGDQLAALVWVRDNIAAFGGDPGQVTLFGQSAGADAALALVAAPDAAGLVRRVILQSAPWGLRGDRAAMTAAMARAARDALPGRAQDAGVPDVLAAQAAALRAAQPFGGVAGMPFAPQPGAWPAPGPEELEAHLRRIAPEVELMVGWTRDDAVPFVQLHPLLGPRVAGRPGLARTLARVPTRRVFASPAQHLARRWREWGGGARTYRIDLRPAGSPFGACHCLELPLLFGDDDAWAGAPILGSDPAGILGRYGGGMRSWWAGFARDGVASEVAVPAGISRIS